MQDTLAVAEVPVCSSRPLARDYVAYVAIAYAFTWTVLIVGVKLGWSEDYLNLSGAGPALAALMLSRSRTPLVRFSGMRWLWFFGLLPVCWIVLSLRTSWWSASSGLPTHLKALQLVPALAPAWILSSFASTNEGIRSIGRRLIHSPNRWTAVCTAVLPAISRHSVSYRIGLRCTSGLAGLRWNHAGCHCHCGNVVPFECLIYSDRRRARLARLPARPLADRFSPLWASLLVWLPWALWHGPVDYYRPVRFTLVRRFCCAWFS